MQLLKVTEVIRKRIVYFLSRDAVHGVALH